MARSRLPATPDSPLRQKWPEVGSWPLSGQALADAISAAGDVRSFGSSALAGFGDQQRADPARFLASYFALAALVPADHRIDELLGWMDEERDPDES